ncbi:MAG TPA: hypothetical protein VGE77_06335 [Nocardioides sp.]
MFLARTLPLSALAVGLVVALGACGTADDPVAPDAADTDSPDAAGGTPATPTPTAPPTVSPSDDAGAGAGEGDDVLDGAVSDLAEREGVAEADVVVVTDAAVQWRSGALGCPETGSFYTQAITPGRQIVLEVAGEKFAYHAGTTGPASYCVNPEEPASE